MSIKLYVVGAVVADWSCVIPEGRSRSTRRTDERGDSAKEGWKAGRKEGTRTMDGRL